MVVVEGRVELVRPRDAAAIDDHHDLFPGCAEGRHHLMEILAQCLSSKMRDDLIEDFGSAILDGTDNAEQHSAGDAAPRAMLGPRLALERLFPFDLALAQRTRGQACTLGFAPPADSRQRKTPQDRLVLIEENNLATAGPVLQGREFERGLSEVRGGGIEPPGGTAGASVLFFHTSRTLSRLSCTPVWRAKTVASA